MAFSTQSLFGRSPIGPFREVMDAVNDCTALLRLLLDACSRGDEEAMSRLDDDIRSRLAQVEADRAGIRKSLPKVLYMSLSRTGLVQLLQAQSALITHIIETAMLIRWRVPPMPPDASEVLAPVMLSAGASIDQALALIMELDELIDDGRMGSDSDLSEEMLDQLSLLDLKAAEVAQGARQLLERTELSDQPGGLALDLRVIDALRELSRKACGIGLAVDFLLPH